MITETTPILSLLLAKGLGVKTLSKLVDRIIEEELAVEDIIEVSPEAMRQRFGLRLSVAEAIHSAHEQAERMAQELEDHEVQILVRGMEPYPNRLCDVLGSNAPPVLFVLGDLSVLSRNAVGFCGARSASEKGIRVASESARQLAEQDVNVVSGYAKGVDLAAHKAAMEAGCVTTIVLAEGILHYRPKREVKSLLDQHNHLVVSEFLPRLPWSGRNAMQRNKTIIGLSDAIICIESGMKGGTYAAAESTLALGLPLFVADYAQPAESAAGNQHFISQGATPLRGDSHGTPNLKQVYEAMGMTTPGETGETVDCEANSSHVAETMPPAREDQESTPKVVQQQVSESRNRYPKRLIEVDLPIARISAHARREKSIRHGHISTLHIWWARRPLAACRAVICAALWPDPSDPICPVYFRESVAEHITAFAKRVFPGLVTNEEKQLRESASPESVARWESIANGALTLDPTLEANPEALRLSLLDFIADFANWDNSTVPAYLETSRALTQAAHEALGGAPETRPLVVDPFAGGGSIPLESLRVGADAFASDLNPVAVLLNKVVLEYIPKYGQRLADEVRKWGQWVKVQAEKELAEFYPKAEDGDNPIAFVWARTIVSDAPGQEAPPVEIPLIRSMWLSKKSGNLKAFRWTRQPDGSVKTTEAIKEFADGTSHLVRQPVLELYEPDNEADVGPGTSAGGSATCPVTGYTTSVERVREMLTSRMGGCSDASLLCVVTTRAKTKGRFYRLPTDEDRVAAANAYNRLSEGLSKSDHVIQSPEGQINHLRGFFNVILYGMSEWRDLYSPRQLLALTTFSRLITDLGEELNSYSDQELVDEIQTCLALVVDSCADHNASLCAWRPGTLDVSHVFGRQALPMTWDFAEVDLTSESTGSFRSALDKFVRVLERESVLNGTDGVVQAASASEHPLPDDSCEAVISDPPYYAAIPYADLSDFFYSWLRLSLQEKHPTLFSDELAPKTDECVSLSHRAAMYRNKDSAWFEERMSLACGNARRIAKPHGVGVFVFANKETSGWEAMLNALICSGWTVTASWPVDTEMGSRLRARNSAVLASSVHLVCRPREDDAGALRKSVGEWRDVLSELPQRIHEWMPRLASEGIVGADAIFACLGPALEIFSRYSRVEKASGEEVPLREYLEHVWAAVSTEALSMIFRDADAAGLEPEARLTAMWLWTLGAGSGKPANGNGGSNGNEKESTVTSKGYMLEFDAARKIAQGLGIQLEKSESIVEVKGDKARLLPVSERTKHLFGVDADNTQTGRGRRKKVKQKTFFEEFDEVEAADAGWTELKGPAAGSTVLDRLHQSMILFAAGRGELMKRFLIEEGVGKDARFWKLAQSLSALYPVGTDEKRWVDGVLARKKGLGL